LNFVAFSIKILKNQAQCLMALGLVFSYEKYKAICQ